MKGIFSFSSNVFLTNFINCFSLFLESDIDLEEFKTSGRKEDAPENKAVFAVKCKYESNINTLMTSLEFTYLIFDIILFQSSRSDGIVLSIQILCEFTGQSDFIK